MLTNIKITLLLTILLFVSSCSNNIDEGKTVENNAVINGDGNKNKSLGGEVLSSGSVNESIYNGEETNLPSSPNFIK